MDNLKKGMRVILWVIAIIVGGFSIQCALHNKIVACGLGVFIFYVLIWVLGTTEDG